MERQYKSRAVFHKRGTDLKMSQEFSWKKNISA
jgi:hypothetical protein